MIFKFIPSDNMMNAAVNFKFFLLKIFNFGDI